MVRLTESYDEAYYSTRGISLELRAEIKDLLSQLKPASDDRVLEIGCGGGDLLKKLERYSSKVTGIDHSLTAVQIAKSKILTSSVSVGSSHMLSFRDNTFDKIVCQHVIEHLDNTPGHIKEWRRVLREGGSLILSTPNFFYPDHQVFFDPEHKHIYSMEELRKLLEENGFLVMNAYSIIPKLHVNVFGRTVRLGARLWKILKILRFGVKRGQTIVSKARAK